MFVNYKPEYENEMRKEQKDLNTQQPIQGYTMCSEDETLDNYKCDPKVSSKPTEKGQFIPFAEALKKLG